MAAEESSSSWWNGLVNAAKETSLAALTATKRDLAEFVTVLKNDTEAAVTGATASLRTLLVEEEEGEGKEGQDEDGRREEGKTKVAYNTTASAAVPMATSRFEAQVYKMEVNPSTYTQPVEGAGHRKWEESFDVQVYTKEISDLLISKQHLQQLHSQLVPTVVSYNDFWGRYFYHLHCINEEVERRASLVARATETVGDCLNWDDDDDDSQKCKEGDHHGNHHGDHHGDIQPQTMSRNNSHLSTPSAPTERPCDRSPWVGSAVGLERGGEKGGEESGSIGESPPKAQEMITADVDVSDSVCPAVDVPPPPPPSQLALSPPLNIVHAVPPSGEHQVDGSTKSDSNDSFVCIPGDQSPTPVPPLTITESWQTINSNDAMEGWEVEPERILKGSTLQSTCTSSSDLVSVPGSEVGGTNDKSGSGHDKTSSSPSEDGGLHLEQLVREMERECGLEPTDDVKGDDTGSLSDDWETWDD